MLAHTSGFKTAITTLGRDINVLIDYYSVVYNLITEDNKLIITQDNLELLTEEMSTQQPTSHLTNDDIILLNRNNLGELFRTYMKSFDLETPHKFNVGDKMIIRVGTTVNGAIEYLNYGLFYVYQRQYNEDKQTYTYTLCDRMLFTMVKYDNDTIFGNNNTLPCSQVVTNILNYCGFSGAIQFENFYFVNNNKSISKETFANVNMTCRDVLDMITQLQGCSLLIGYDATTKKDYITNKRISQSSVDTIDDDILKNSNITLGKKYGKLNSLLFSRSEGIDNIERKDDTSILEDGKTQYVIKDNLILNQENRVDFIDNLFNVMNGLEYYICDIDTIGLGYIEYLDRFTINANGNLYNTICLKNTCNISNGMNENYTTEELQETAQTFENIGYDDKKASVLMDKLKGEIVLKTDSDGKLAQVRLDSSGDEGSLVEITGDQINLAGKNIDLTGDSITISSDKFNVDEEGNMTCTNASITGRFEATGNNGQTLCSVASGNFNAYYFIGANRYHCNIDGIGITYDTNYVEDSSFGRRWCYVRNADTGDYVDIDNGNVKYTGSLIQGSKEELKKNFEKLNNALNIIKNIDIYKYNLKSQENEKKKHIGLVIGKKYKYSEDVLNDENSGVDLYSFISVCCKAIQEQQEEIEELKKEINNLKGGNK